ncbi:MAG TPA: hypothetical protein VMH26_20495, partial [Burkholderiales bacterium]|nr:hypothetical protein [Burkholderiales bacterium]
MTRLPEAGGLRGAAPHGTVVVFRVAVEEDGKPIQATLSTRPRWKWHYLVNVGPPPRPLDTGRTFAAGQLDATSSDAGWGFLTLPPGTYHLAFAAYRTKFAMPGAQRAALGFGQSGASQFEVPADANVLYVGTFALTCHRVDRWWFYEEHECTKLEVRDEEGLAGQVASTSLSRFGPMRTALASTR